MSSISAYYNEINKYNALKVKLFSIVDYLNSSAVSIEKLPQSLSTVFTLNDNDTCISKNCNTLNSDIVATSNYIKNVVIPGIDNSIRKCKNQIAKLEAQANTVV